MSKKVCEHCGMLARMTKDPHQSVPQSHCVYHCTVCNGRRVEFWNAKRKRYELEP